MLNRVVLLLNLVVLLVTFLLALSTTDSQVDIMESTSRIANGMRFTGGRDTLDRDVAIAFLRVVQSVEDYVPRRARDALDAGKLAVIRDAVVVYYDSVARGVARAAGTTGGPDRIRQVLREIGEEARSEVQQALQAAFQDPGFVKRLTVEIIRHCT